MMEKKRKIETSVKKVSFKEAEEADDVFYASLSPEKRFDILIDLRRSIFGGINKKIEKVVRKKSIHEAAEN